MLQLPNSPSSGGVGFYALDSYVFTTDNVDNFVEDGSPYQDTLWTLTLIGNGVVANPKKVAVDFELNPAALNELSLPTWYLMSLPGYSKGLGAGVIASLIDNQIDTAVESDLRSDGDEVTLDDPSLFPAGTLFQPANSGEEFADGVLAVETVVLEPTSLSLLVGLLGIRSRHKKSCLAGIRQFPISAKGLLTPGPHTGRCRARTPRSIAAATSGSR